MADELVFLEVKTILETIIRTAVEIIINAREESAIMEPNVRHKVSSRFAPTLACSQFGQQGAGTVREADQKYYLAEIVSTIRPHGTLTM